MSDFGASEECWKIPSGRINVPARLKGNAIFFDAGLISYQDYENVGSKIDYDRVFVDGISTSDYRGSDGQTRGEINGKKILHGTIGSSYSYDNGRASFVFKDAEECIEHAKRIEDRGLIKIIRIE